MLGDNFFHALASYSGEELTGREQKQLAERHAVECLLRTLYPDDAQPDCRNLPNDPPDIEFETQNGVVGVEVVAIVHGPARAATKAFREGKPVPGYSHPQEIPLEQQGFVWKISETDLVRAVRAQITLKARDLARWPQNVFSQRWLLVVIDPNDHDAEISEIENWLFRIGDNNMEFDRVFALTSDYDPKLRSPRTIEIGSV